MRRAKSDANQSESEKKYVTASTKTERCPATLVGDLVPSTRDSKPTSIQLRQMNWLRPLAITSSKPSAGRHPSKRCLLRLKTKRTTPLTTFEAGY